METVECQTLKELESFFDGLAPGVLFRGQTKEYLRADGADCLIARDEMRARADLDQELFDTLYGSVNDVSTPAAGSAH